MATPVTSSATPPPAPSVVAQANQSLGTIKAGRDPLRPFRYAIKFVSGTIGSTLDGFADWGRKGFWAGGGLGIVAAIATGGLAPLFIGAFGGLLVSGLAGSAVGLLTGGLKSVNRQRRGEKYADDLLVRSKMQEEAPPSRADYRHAYRQRGVREADATTEYILQREAEARRDAAANNPNTHGSHYNTSPSNGNGVGTYWQDRVQTSTSADRTMER